MPFEAWGLSYGSQAHNNNDDEQGCQRSGDKFPGGLAKKKTHVEMTAATSTKTATKAANGTTTWKCPPRLLPGHLP